MHRVTSGLRSFIRRKTGAAKPDAVTRAVEKDKVGDEKSTRTAKSDVANGVMETEKEDVEKCNLKTAEMEPEKIESGEAEKEAAQEHHPYVALLCAFRMNMDRILNSYGRQKRLAGVTSELQREYVKAGADKAAAEGKRRYLKMCLESSVVPPDVIEAKCLKLWKTVEKEHRIQQIAKMSMLEILNTDHIKLSQWIRVVVPAQRKYTLFDSIVADVETIRIGMYEKEGSITMKNEREEAVNFTIKTNIDKFFPYPSEGIIEAYGESRILVARLVNERSRGKLDILVGNETRTILVILAKVGITGGKNESEEEDRRHLDATNCRYNS